MKKVVLLAVLLCSVSSFAGPVQFKPNSPLPNPLRELIAKTINEKCITFTANAWPVYESHTQVYSEPADTMSHSLEYTTTFVVMGMDSDNMHPENFPMRVISVTENLHTASKMTSRVVRIDAGSHCQL